MTDTGKPPACEYKRLENGIHCFIFHEATHEAIDQWMIHLGTANSVTPPGAVQLQLMDARRTGLPPIRYAVKVARKFFKDNPNQPQVRAAYLITPNVLLSAVQSLLSTFRGPGSHRRFFDPDREDEAIAWLLEGLL